MTALQTQLDVGTTGRKALAELLGSALLATTVVGSGIAAQRLSPDDVGLQLLQNSLVGTERAGGGLWLGEVVATAGLVVVVFGVLRSGRASSVAFAVAGWITAAYWATSSTSFANPAITVGRTLSDTFAGIAPSSAPLFVVVQLLGGALGLLAALVLYPATAQAAARLTHLTSEEAP